MAYKAQIPYGAYWSTPFARWQGSFANLHSIEFAAHVTKQELAKRKIAGEAIDHGVLGITVLQKHSFFGLPWFTGLAGLGHVSGPTVMQACATSVRVLATAAEEIETGLARTALAASLPSDQSLTDSAPTLSFSLPKSLSRFSFWHLHGR